MSKVQAVVVVGTLLAGAAVGNASLAQADLTVSPVSSTVSVGGVFSVDIDISGVNDLYGYQFDVAFNPTVLTAVSSTEGSFLSKGGDTYFIPGVNDNVGGKVSATADTLIGPAHGVSGSGTIAVLTFDATKTGSSNISISGVDLVNSNLGIITSQAGGGVVHVGSIRAPEIDPASAASALTLLMCVLVLTHGRFAARNRGGSA